MASNHVVMQFLDVRQIGRKGLYDNKLSFLYKFKATKISPKWHSIYILISWGIVKCVFGKLSKRKIVSNARTFAFETIRYYFTMEVIGFLAPFIPIRNALALPNFRNISKRIGI